MENKHNMYVAVAYKLMADENGETVVIEEATAEKPFQFISGFGITLDAFENQMMQCLKEDENAGVLLVMDVDKFKSINDNYGHTFGDLVLHTFGQNLAGTFPQSSLCGRFGGDEFVVWMPGILAKKEITEHLDELVDRIHSIKTPDGKIVITSSIGIAECPENGKTYQELFENADAALYTAKNLGRNRYVFCPDMGKGI